ncbi:Lpp/OprI family alanine-zipper lipoprotein [Vibrio alfacsensis]|uniref:Lpp/OprI family alanine-zipper lipoprotein n=1 Tax=Vibrio alfacsensis TaxID=1074311 RepID=UPI00406840C7
MNKTLIAATAASVLLLAGCASSDDAAMANAEKLDQLSNQVSQLSQDVQSLQSDVQAAGGAAMAAQEEAARANERIDNIAQSYTK